MLKRVTWNLWRLWVSLNLHSLPSPIPSHPKLRSIFNITGPQINSYDISSSQETCLLIVWPWARDFDFLGLSLISNKRRVSCDLSGLVQGCKDINIHKLTLGCSLLLYTVLLKKLAYYCVHCCSSTDSCHVPREPSGQLREHGSSVLHGVTHSARESHSSLAFVGTAD